MSVIFAPPVRNYRARSQEVLVALGVLDGAHVRPPLLPLERAERAAVREAVERARLKSPAGRSGDEEDGDARSCRSFQPLRCGTAWWCKKFPSVIFWRAMVGCVDSHRNVSGTVTDTASGNHVIGVYVEAWRQGRSWR